MSIDCKRYHIITLNDCGQGYDDDVFHAELSAEQIEELLTRCENTSDISDVDDDLRAHEMFWYKSQVRHWLNAVSIDSLGGMDPFIYLLNRGRDGFNTTLFVLCSDRMYAIVVGLIKAHCDEVMELPDHISVYLSQLVSR